LETYHLSVEPQLLREAMRQWTTGVTVLSSCHEGHQHGMTVNSFTSISLDPPVILVSLNRESRTHALVTQSGVFGVTILADDQQAVAERFAGQVADDADRFEGLETFDLVTGSPLICGGLAFLDCEVKQAVDIGGSTLFLGLVIGTAAVRDVNPLVYHRRGYHRLDGT